MKNIALWLMFDGTAYHGFQRQKNGITVQECLENAVFAVTGERVNIIGCSRTDAGVHARNYVAMLKTGTRIPMSSFGRALNSALPEDIRIIEAAEVSESFHPIFSAIEKTYTYSIVNRRTMDVFRLHHAWFYPKPLCVEKMQEAAALFIGEHDFTSFMAAGGSTKTSIRNIKDLVVSEKDGIILITVTANGFLYNMVRIITGTLVYVGNGKIKPEDISDIITACDRRKAGITAPPEGLCLDFPKYSIPIFKGEMK